MTFSHIGVVQSILITLVSSAFIRINKVPFTDLSIIFIYGQNSFHVCHKLVILYAYSPAVDHFTFVLTDIESKFRFGFCRLAARSQTCLCILRYVVSHTCLCIVRCVVSHTGVSVHSKLQCFPHLRICDFFYPDFIC